MRLLPCTRDGLPGCDSPRARCRNHCAQNDAGGGHCAQPVDVLGWPRRQSVGAGARAARERGGARRQPHSLRARGDGTPSRGIRVRIWCAARPDWPAAQCRPSVGFSVAQCVATHPIGAARAHHACVRQHREGDRRLRAPAHVCAVALRPIRGRRAGGPTAHARKCILDRRGGWTAVVHRQGKLRQLPQWSAADR